MKRGKKVVLLKPRPRLSWKRPWNDLNVQLELHFCPSLQARWGVPPVVYEPFELIYPKLHEERKKSHG